MIIQNAILVSIITTSMLCYGAEQTQEPPKETTLYSFGGPVKITPEPKLHDDSLRIKIQKVELIKDAKGDQFTKITYKPWYGKINSESQKFREEHETQEIAILVFGDKTQNIKKDDILRYCWYQN